MGTHDYIILVVGLTITLQYVAYSKEWSSWSKHSLMGMNVHLGEICTNSMDILHGSSENLAYHLHHNIDSEYLEVRIDKVMNRTVHTTKEFSHGEYICEYAGEYLDANEVDRTVEEESGAFTYILQYQNLVLDQLYNVDAKEESDRFCRLINHSWKVTNVDVFPFVYRNQIRLLFLATRGIRSGEELFFDYGIVNRDKEELIDFPWLNT